MQIYKKTKELKKFLVKDPSEAKLKSYLRTNFTRMELDYLLEQEGLLSKYRERFLFWKEELINFAAAYYLRRVKKKIIKK